MTEAQFHIGQIVHHRRFDYRGVVYDSDPVFMGTEEWYDSVAKSRPPKDKPWYHVLVDGSDHMTYVAERHLEPSGDSSPIRHPLIEELFETVEPGTYKPRQLAH